MTSEPDGPLDDFEHRLLWLGRVRAGVQRALMAVSRPGSGRVGPAGPPRWSDELHHLLTGLPISAPEAMAVLDTELREYDARIQSRLEKTRAERGEAPGDALRRSFGLSFEEECVLWAAAAPEVDVGAARLYQLVGAATTDGVLLHMLLRIALGSAHRLLDGAIGLLAEDRPLIRLRLLVGSGRVTDPLQVSLTHALRVNPAVALRLAGVPVPARPNVSVLSAEPPEFVCTDAFERRMAREIQRAGRGRSGLRLWLVGPEGCGKRSVVGRLAHDLSRPHWVVDVAGLLEESGTGGALRDIFREARCERAVLQLRGGAALLDGRKGSRAALRLLIDLMGDHPGEVIFDSTEDLTLPSDFPRIFKLDVPAPGVDVRRTLWTRALPDRVDADVADGLARRFFLTGGQIVSAARRSADYAAGRTPTFSEVAAEARKQQKDDVGALAQRVEHGLGWKDIVLADEVTEQLREVLHYAKHKARIFDEWGFYRKLPYGRGLSILLSGPPGTGKTMLASVLARDLELDLYRVDLAQITSKYIGETEKHLQSIFDYATSARAALLFDEADSLFATRTEVSSSVDRYANLEVNYLLQRIEAYEGVCVLTTNFKQSLDDALLRRVRFKIELPAPDAKQRERLWRSMIPAEAPVTPNLDFTALAREFDLAGGHIKNSVVRAAIAAAAANEPISNALLRQAANVTCRELGILVRS